MALMIFQIQLTANEVTSKHNALAKECEIASVQLAEATATRSAQYQRNRTLLSTAMRKKQLHESGTFQ